MDFDCTAQILFGFPLHRANFVCSQATRQQAEQPRQGAPEAPCRVYQINSYIGVEEYLNTINKNSPIKPIYNTIESDRYLAQLLLNKFLVHGRQPPSELMLTIRAIGNVVVVGVVLDVVLVAVLVVVGSDELCRGLLRGQLL